MENNKLEVLLNEVESIANYLTQQVKNGSITGELYKQKIERYVVAYEEYKISIKQRS
jgi:hypothetical protein